MKKLLCIMLGTMLLAPTAFAQFRLSESGLKLEQTLQLIENLYVDSANTNKLAETAIRSMLSELDPHSVYMNAEEVRAMNEPLEGNFDGIGIAFNMMTDTLYVMEVISGGPSEKVGIRPGDKFILVNDTLISGVKMGNTDVIKKLRGPKGTTVNVKAIRRGVPGMLEFNIVRDKIPIYSIDAAYMADENTGYIRLSRFGATSYNEFTEARDRLKKQGMKDLILDLTGNGGGILQIAGEIVDEFLKRDQMMVYTEGLHQPRFPMKATAKGGLENGNVVVLVDEGSASASEIVAGALQDWDRAVIVGRRTFGKGLVQKQIPLQDNTVIRLTVARYYTPTGRSIQKPYVGGDADSYNKDLIDRYNKGEMLNADSIHFPDSLKYTTLINGRTVYGGGGIMPDYFVPLDTTRIVPYDSTRLLQLPQELLFKGVINRVAIHEVDNHREELLKEYPTVEAFKTGYRVSPRIEASIRSFADGDSIKWDEQQYLTAKEYLHPQLKALIARDLYDSSAYFRIMNDELDIFKAGMQIINDQNRYEGLLKGDKN